MNIYYIYNTILEIYEFEKITKRFNVFKLQACCFSIYNKINKTSRKNLIYSFMHN